MIKNVVFDVGKVLVEFDWQGCFDTLNFSPEAYEKVAHATVLSELWNEFDRGRMPEEDILEGFLKKAPDCEPEIMRFWNNIGNSIKRYDYAFAWIRKLREQGYRVYLLSNYPRRLYFQSMEELAFVEEVDGAVFSYEVQSVKPEPDDNRANIIAANQLGMATIHFHTKSQAEEELRSLGVE